jgi:hypothetical protein
MVEKNKRNKNNKSIMPVSGIDIHLGSIGQ